MKLFHQLTEFEQEQVIFNFVMDIVHEFLELGLEFSPLEHTEPEVREKLQVVLDKALKFNEHEEQIDFLLESEDFSDMAYSVAYSLSEKAFYAEIGDLCVNLAEVVDYEGQEEITEDKKELQATKDKSLN